VRDDPGAKLQAQSHAGEGLRAVALADLTDFDWDHVVFLGPYCTRDAANKALGFDWPGFEDSGIATTDFYSLIVFTEGERVTRWWKLRRCAPDIDLSLEGVRVSREQARLLLRNTEHCSVLTRATPR